MSEINIYSFAAVLLVSYLGAYFHWRKMKKQGRVGGTFWDYLVADRPGRSMGTGAAILGATWLNVTSGLGDNLNPELVWQLLAAGKLHVPTFAAIATSFLSGYGLDSQINRSEEVEFYG